MVFLSRKLIKCLLSFILLYSFIACTQNYVTCSLAYLYNIVEEIPYFILLCLLSSDNGLT